jgi:hypothetical protein
MPAISFGGTEKNAAFIAVEEGNWWHFQKLPALLFSGTFQTAGTSILWYF